MKEYRYITVENIMGTTNNFIITHKNLRCAKRYMKDYCHKNQVVRIYKFVEVNKFAQSLTKPTQTSVKEK